MTSKKIREQYLEWLSDMVRAGPEYSMLIYELHSIEFYWFINLDANRAADGVILRSYFLDEFGYNGPVWDDPCSVLEMLIGLALRGENDILYDGDYGDRTHVWFWIFIENLGLNEMTNDHFDRGLVQNFVGHFLDREYLRDGFGGLFRLKRDKNDMRGTEIWTQFCWWVNENIDWLEQKSW